MFFFVDEKKNIQRNKGKSLKYPYQNKFSCFSAKVLVEYNHRLKMKWIRKPCKLNFIDR